MGERPPHGRTKDHTHAPGPPRPPARRPVPPRASGPAPHAPRLTGRSGSPSRHRRQRRSRCSRSTTAPGTRPTSTSSRKPTTGSRRPAPQNGFTYTATTNWNLLNSRHLAQYKVVMFLDDAPQPAAQRPRSSSTCRTAGPGWASTSPRSPPTPELALVLQQVPRQRRLRRPTPGARPPRPCTSRTAPTRRPAHLPATFTSSVSEWYSWSNDLRNNPNIDILASVDPCSFPVGTDPNQTWYSGYYPIMWTNTQLQDAVRQLRPQRHELRHQHPRCRRPSPARPRTACSSTACMWLRHRLDRRPPAPTDPHLADRLVQPGRTPATASASTPGRPPRPTAPRSSSTPATPPPRSSSSSSRPTAASSASTTAQQRAGRRRDQRVHGRQRPDPALDVQRRAPTSSGSRSREGGGCYHFTARHSGKCLSVPAGGGAQATAARPAHVRRLGGPVLRAGRLAEHPPQARPTAPRKGRPPTGPDDRHSLTPLPDAPARSAPRTAAARRRGRPPSRSRRAA